MLAAALLIARHTEQEFRGIVDRGIRWMKRLLLRAELSPHTISSTRVDGTPAPQLQREPTEYLVAQVDCPGDMSA